jgi:Putative Actinobacterial Holin-X, holin superfamily III
MPDGNGHADTRTTADQPISELVQQLTEQTSRLARQEVALAKAELTEKGKRAGVGAGMFGGSGLFALYAVGCLTAAVILGLATVMEGWIAALIVGVVYLAVAGILALTGRRKVQESTPPAPEQAIASVKADVAETKRHFEEGRR